MTFKTVVNTALVGADITNVESMKTALLGLDDAHRKVALSILKEAGADTQAVASRLAEIDATNLVCIAKAKEVVFDKAHIADTDGSIAANLEELAATGKLTAAKLKQILAKNGIVGKNAEEILASAGVTTATGVEATMMDVLTASIWANIKAVAVWLVTNLLYQDSSM